MVKALGTVPYLDQFPVVADVDKFILDNLGNLDLRTYIGSVINSLSSIVGNLALIIVYVIFLLIEENFIPLKTERVFGDPERRNTVKLILNHIGLSINKYFFVKTSMSLLTGMLSYILLLVFGVDFAVLWAFLIFVFNYIPYVGSLVATLLPAFFTIFQFASFWPFLWVLLSIEAVQILVGNYIEPKVMGKTLNLSPLVVVLALAFWGAIWGIIGMILSVPIVSVLVIIMAHFPNTRNVAIFFSERGTIDGDEDVIKKSEEIFAYEA
jgi:predicted PurR-regulated permease PerM